MPTEASSRCSNAFSMIEPLPGCGHGLSRAVQFLAQAQLQFAGSFVGKRHRDNVVDCGSAARQHTYNPRHQLRCFACAGRRFHQQALAERGTDSLARQLIVPLSFDCRRHGRFRTCTSASSRSAGLRLARCSS